MGKLLNNDNMVSIQKSIMETIFSYNGLFSFFDMSLLERECSGEYPINFSSKNKEITSHYAVRDNIITLRNEPFQSIVVPTYEIGICADWFVGEKFNIDEIIHQFKQFFINKMNEDASRLLFVAGSKNICYATAFTNLLRKFINTRNPNKKLPICVFANNRLFSRLSCSLPNMMTGIRLETDFKDYKIIVFRLCGQDHLSLGQRLISLFAGPMAVVAQNVHGEFVMPIRPHSTIFRDPSFNRLERDGLCGCIEVGFGILNNQNITLGFCP